MMVAIPAETAVTSPLVFTMAMVLSLELQLPPVTEGVSVVDSPSHNILSPVMVIFWFGSTVIVVEGKDAQPLLEVKVNVAVPALIP